MCPQILDLRPLWPKMLKIDSLLNKQQWNADRGSKTIAVKYQHVMKRDT